MWPEDTYRNINLVLTDVAGNIGHLRQTYNDLFLAFHLISSGK